MYRTYQPFTLLQAMAVIAGLAVLLWSVGFPALRFAMAANVTSFSNTLSTSESEEPANHTISFVTPNGMVAGEIVTIGFPIEFTNIDNLVADDVDLNVNGVERSLIDGPASTSDWQVVASGQTIDLISDTDTIPANATVTIRIGTNATSGGAGVNQIVNPIAFDSYEITVALGNTGDSGTTIVVILAQVTVTAIVETVFDFTVTGVGAGPAIFVNGDVVTATSTSNGIPFGVLAHDTAVTAAQDLTVNTNAANGFVITVQTDRQLTSANDATIDGFFDGTYEADPTLWDSPSALVEEPDTYGHWGLTTDDDTISPSLTDLFAASTTGRLYVSASTTPVEVFRNDGPAKGETQGVGITRVGYTVEISALQEAANDYTATLTYVATPVF